MNLKVDQNLIIPSNEIQWRFSRASGPGGQNINKVESQVEIIFNIHKSKAINSFQKNLLLKKLNIKMINGFIYIKVREKRSQYQNRQLAIKKLITLITIIIMSETKVRKKHLLLYLLKEKELNQKRKEVS